MNPKKQRVILASGIFAVSALLSVAPSFAKFSSPRIPASMLPNSNAQNIPLTQPAQLARIANDHDDSISVLSLTLDDSSVVQGVQFNSSGSSLPPTELKFTLADIATRDGVILMKYQGQNIFYMRGAIDSVAGSGSVTLRYLANGVWGTYVDCPAKVARTADGNWHLYNVSTGQVVTDAFVETYSLGVRAIHGLCTENFSFAPTVPVNSFLER